MHRRRKVGRRACYRPDPDLVNEALEVLAAIASVEMKAAHLETFHTLGSGLVAIHRFRETVPGRVLLPSDNPVDVHPQQFFAIPDPGHMLPAGPRAFLHWSGQNGLIRAFFATGLRHKGHPPCGLRRFFARLARRARVLTRRLWTRVHLQIRRSMRKSHYICLKKVESVAEAPLVTATSKEKHLVVVRINIWLDPCF